MRIKRRLMFLTKMGNSHHLCKSPVTRPTASPAKQKSMRGHSGW